MNYENTKIDIVKRNLNNTIRYYQFKAKNGTISSDELIYLNRLKQIRLVSDKDLKMRLIQAKNDRDTKRSKYMRDIIKPIDDEIESITHILEFTE